MKVLLIYIVLCSFAYSAERARPLYQDQTSFEISSDFFYRTASFDADGNLIPMNFQDEYYLTDGNLRFSYGVTADLELSAILKIRNIHSATAVKSQSKTGMEGYGGLLKYRIASWHSSILSFVGGFWKSAYTNNVFNAGNLPDDELVLGNDGSFSNLGALLEWRVSESWVFDLDVRYQNPPSYLSQYISFDSELRLNNLLVFRFGAKGEVSLRNDAFTDNPQDKPLFSNGQTTLFNGVNQERIFATGFIGFKSPGMEIRGEVARTFYGINTDEGTLFSANIIFKSAKKREDKSSADSSFKEYSNSALVIQVSPRGNF